MKRRTLLMMVSSLVVVTAAAFIIAGCGGSKTPSSAKSGNLIGSGRTGEIVLTIDWGKSRLIPPSTVKVDVTITGDGLVDPFRDSIPRPSGQTTVTKVYTLPVGVKHVTAEAKDANDQTVAAGVGTTTLSEGQRTDLVIEMSEITARTVLVRTFRGKQQAPPDFIAFQDGNGPWQIAQGSGGQYTLTINDPAGRYGVAIVCVSNNNVDVNILHATWTELKEINHECGMPPSQNLVTISGEVSGLDNEYAHISVDGRFGFAYWLSPSYTLQVPPGIYDLVAAKFSDERFGANKIFIQRNISISGDTTINIDFNSPDAFDPETHNAVIDGVSSGELAEGGVNFLSHNGTEIRMGSKFESQPPTIQFQFSGIPISKQVGNDIHLLFAGAFSADSFRRFERYFKAPVDISATLPSPFGNASVTVATTTPYARFTASWDAYSGAQAYFAEFGSDRRSRQQLVSNAQPSKQKRRSRQEVSRHWMVGLSVGWLGGQSSYTLPDLSGLSGWNNNWGIPAGTQVPWVVGAVATNRPIQDFVNAEVTPVDGLEVRIAAKRGTVTP